MDLSTQNTPKHTQEKNLRKTLLHHLPQKQKTHTHAQRLGGRRAEGEREEPHHGSASPGAAGGSLREGRRREASEGLHRPLQPDGASQTLLPDEQFAYEASGTSSSPQSPFLTKPPLRSSLLPLSCPFLEALPLAALLPFKALPRSPSLLFRSSSLLAFEASPLHLRASLQSPLLPRIRDSHKMIPEKPKRAHWVGHGFEPRHNSTRRPPEKRRKNKNCGGRGKNSANLWVCPLCGPRSASPPPCAALTLRAPLITPRDPLVTPRVHHWRPLEISPKKTAGKRCFLVVGRSDLGEGENEGSKG